MLLKKNFTYTEISQNFFSTISFIAENFHRKKFFIASTLNTSFDNRSSKSSTNTKTKSSDNTSDTGKTNSGTQNSLYSNSSYGLPGPRERKRRYEKSTAQSQRETGTVKKRATYISKVMNHGKQKDCINPNHNGLLPEKIASRRHSRASITQDEITTRSENRKIKIYDNEAMEPLSVQQLGELLDLHMQNEDGQTKKSPFIEHRNSTNPTDRTNLSDLFLSKSIGSQEMISNRAAISENLIKSVHQPVNYLSRKRFSRKGDIYPIGSSLSCKWEGQDGGLGSRTTTLDSKNVNFSNQYKNALSGNRRTFSKDHPISLGNLSSPVSITRYTKTRTVSTLYSMYDRRSRCKRFGLLNSRSNSLTTIKARSKSLILQPTQCQLKLIYSETTSHAGPAQCVALFPPN